MFVVLFCVVCVGFGAVCVYLNLVRRDPRNGSTGHVPAPSIPKPTLPMSRATQNRVGTHIQVVAPTLSPITLLIECAFGLVVVRSFYSPPRPLGVAALRMSKDSKSVMLGV